MHRSYQFHPPDTTIDTDRPAYGGTCYSDLPWKTNVPVVAYDEYGDTASKAFSQSTSGAQAFAHPIDGWALTSPTIIGCPTSSASLTSDADSGSAAASNSQSSLSSHGSSQGGAGADANPQTTTTAKSSNSGVSTGAIVGATIGACVALVALVGLVWLLLARRRKNANARPSDPQQMNDDFGEPKVYNRFEAPASTAFAHETSAYPQEKAEWRPSQLNDGHGAFEMQASSAAEMPADLPADGKKGADAKVREFHAH